MGVNVMDVSNGTLSAESVAIVARVAMGAPAWRETNQSRALNVVGGARHKITSLPRLCTRAPNPATFCPQSLHPLALTCRTSLAEFMASIA